MRYFVAEAPNNETGEPVLHPNWFAVPTVGAHDYPRIACEEYLKTRDAIRAKVRIVEVEITRV